MLSELPCVIRNYRFLKLIGKGGFSVVYLVQNVKFKSQFVAKVIPLSSDLANLELISLESEVSSLKTLNHPHIIRLYDHFVEGRYYYLILEYCPNGSLTNEIANQKPMSHDKFIIVARQIIDALSFCHSHSIAHRDIKLGNILLDKYGRVKLADFGISLQTSGGSHTQSFSGSIEYEAPEILNKQPHDPFKADIWALGVLFAFMANGQSPWGSCDTLGKLRKFVNAGKYHLRRFVPKDICDVIAQMIVVEPTSRISIEQLKKLPIFNDPNAVAIADIENDSVSDVLSPRGRALMSMGPTNGSCSYNYSKYGIAGTESYNGTSFASKTIQLKAIALNSLNASTGINHPPKLKARMHTIVKPSTFYYSDDLEFKNEA